MKAVTRFFRTTAGKTIIFILTLLMGISFAASLLGIVALNDLRFYSYSEKTIYQSTIAGEIRALGSRVISEHINVNDFEYYYYGYRNDASFSNVQYIYKKSDNDTIFYPDSVTTTPNLPDTWDFAILYRVMQYKNQTDQDDVNSVDYLMDVDPQNIPKDIAALDPFADTSDNSATISYYIFYANVNLEQPVSNSFYMYYQMIHELYQLRYSIYPLALAFLLLTIASFIALMKVSARIPDSEDLHPGIMHRVPTDVMIIGVSSLILAGIYFFDEMYYDEDTIWWISLIFLSLLSLCLLLGLCMSLAARCKDHSIVKNTLLVRLLSLLHKGAKWGFHILVKAGRLVLSFIHSIPLIWRTILITLFLVISNFIILCIASEIIELAIVLYLLLCLLVIPFFWWIVLQLRKLQKAGFALASGDLSYHTDTKWMFWDFKKHGENLNDIAKGMTVAVEKQIKSERMKTELITNVSHDIKTPLTSIISYSTLIEQEPCENEHIHEYSEVLIRQSERLKRLIEDLVEASKASTGNLEVTLAPCDLSILLMQAGGEYEQRMENAGLTFVQKQPEESIHIMADGRRMWRVFDNLLGNICKYGQSGTRVYVTLERKEQNAIITFKNTSRASLDLSPDELMERFVRGDASRNTEGNGLGLSIAKSLVELQHGSFDLQIDGDLFKVILVFPIMQNTTNS